MRNILGIALLILILIPFSVLAEYQPGDPVADFQLPNAYGNTVHLYDYSDYIVIMPFWETG